MSKLKFFAAFLVLNTIFILSCSNVDDLDLPKPGPAESDQNSSSGNSSSGDNDLSSSSDNGISSSGGYVPTHSSAFVGEAIDQGSIVLNVEVRDNFDRLNIYASVDINPASGKVFDYVEVKVDGVKINDDGDGNGFESFTFDKTATNGYDISNKKYCDDNTHYVCLYAYIDGEAELKDRCETFVRNKNICDPPSSSSVPSSGSNPSSSSSSSFGSNPSSSSSSSSNPSSGSNPNIQGDWDFERSIFIDQRDGKEYGFAISGNGQIWMTQNLNYSGDNTLGWCYDVNIDGPDPHRDAVGCNKPYGRTYDYTAVQTGGFPRGICPQGWHVPTRTELGTASALTRIYAGNYNLNEEWPPLGWKERGTHGYYWTSSGNNYFAIMFNESGGIGQEAQTDATGLDKFSVRCLADATQYCNGTPYEIGNKSCCGGTLIYDPAMYSCNGGSLEEKTYVLFEDFEGTSSNWSILSGSGTNRWIISTSTYYVDGGSRSAYITSNGSSYGYSENSTSTSNLYTTVSFPSQTPNFTLSFNWKGIGESSYDNMTVYLVPFDVSVTNAAPTSGKIGVTYEGSPNWTLENINLPASTYSGKTYRLVFHWKNDSSVGSTPAAIDNVRITN